MLFRKEVLEEKADRLTGEVQVAVPIPWQAIGYLLFGSIAAALIFLALGSYARIETVTGSIVPDAGVSLVLPTRTGTISEISVRDGQYVEKGAPLVRIRSELDSPSGGSSEGAIAAAIVQQDSSLAVQMAAINAATQAQRTQLVAQRAGLSAEIGQLESQLVYQKELVSSAEDDISRTKVVADRGFISARDMRTREDQLLSRRQGLSQITQALASKRAALIEAQRSTAQMEAQAVAQSASISASRAQVAQAAASTDGSRGYVIRAPFAGRVSGLTAKVGQQVSTQSPLMSVVPQGAVLQAQLAVPTTAIGFVKKGQVVRLAVDAFPYQKFGTVEGRVLSVSQSAIPQQTANGAAVAVYPVTVALGRETVEAYHRQERLLPGMSLTARVVADRQSLFEWLFEPLFAVRKR
nr:HlyD family efflux transporter periplasmic adaptor subunit [uncultured Sphingomonas sp.]